MSSGVHPDLVGLFRTEIPADDLGFAGDPELTNLFGFAALPFGWAGSPTYFKMITDVATAAHSDFTPPKPLWRGMTNFECFPIVGESFGLQFRLEID